MNLYTQEGKNIIQYKLLWKGNLLRGYFQNCVRRRNLFAA